VFSYAVGSCSGLATVGSESPSDLEDLEHAMCDLLARSEADPPAAVLVDLTQLDDYRVQAAARCAEHLMVVHRGHVGPIALLTSGLGGLIMARSLALYLSYVGFHTEVFTDRPSALAWLLDSELVVRSSASVASARVGPYSVLGSNPTTQWRG
jgi:hypothetical protein